MNESSRPCTPDAGSALRYAADSLKADKEVVIAAVRKAVPASYIANIAILIHSLSSPGLYLYLSTQVYFLVDASCIRKIRGTSGRRRTK